MADGIVAGLFGPAYAPRVAVA